MAGDTFLHCVCLVCAESCASNTLWWGSYMFSSASRCVCARARLCFCICFGVAAKVEVPELNGLRTNCRWAWLHQKPDELRPLKWLCQRLQANRRVRVLTLERNRRLPQKPHMHRCPNSSLNELFSCRNAVFAVKNLLHGMSCGLVGHLPHAESPFADLAQPVW